MNIIEVLSKKYTITYIDNNEISIDCPNCGKGGKHFQISLLKGMGHCFRCDFKTSIKRLVADILRIPIEEVKGVISKGRKKSESKTVNIPEIKLPPNGGWTLRARQYLNERGLSSETIRKFGLYFCNSGYFSGRIIIPVKFNNRVVSFQARSIRENQGKRYLFPKGSPSGKVIYNFDSIRPRQRLIIVEGPFDCMMVDQSGYTCIATFGKKITKDQIGLIESLQPKKITLFYDSDADIHETFKTLNRRFFVDVATLVSGDPAECPNIHEVLGSTSSSVREHEMAKFEYQLAL